MQCQCKKFAGKQNKSYRSVIKTLLPEKQTWGRSKHVRSDERFLSLEQIDKLYHEQMKYVYGKKSFLSTESNTKILQSIYFAYKVGIISSYSNRIW